LDDHTGPLSVIAYGSDPYDASDHPAPTAGSDHDNATGTEEVSSVSSLPNTGTGFKGESESDSLLIALGGLALAAGAYATRRARA
jgi:hypothetical protein